MDELERRLEEEKLRYGKMESECKELRHRCEDLETKVDKAEIQVLEQQVKWHMEHEISEKLLQIRSQSEQPASTCKKQLKRPRSWSSSPVITSPLLHDGVISGEVIDLEGPVEDPDTEYMGGMDGDYIPFDDNESINSMSDI